jgi:hypothetical protein
VACFIFLSLRVQDGFCPTVLDVVVTRDPARMLPGVDAHALTVEKGDRPA